MNGVRGANPGGVTTRVNADDDEVNNSGEKNDCEHAELIADAECGVTNDAADTDEATLGVGAADADEARLGVGAADETAANELSDEDGAELLSSLDVAIRACGETVGLIGEGLRLG